MILPRLSLLSRGLFACAILIILTSWQSAQAQCCGAVPTTFKQPDGTVIEVHFHGNEKYTRTTSADGYTLIFDTNTKAYFYAELSPSGDSFRSTGKLAKQNKPADVAIAKHLELKPEVRAKLATRRAEELEAIRQDKARWEEQKQAMAAVRAHKKKMEDEAKKKGKADAPSPDGTSFESGTGGETGIQDPAYAPPVNPPTLGNLVGLTILVDFSDVPARSDVTRADFDDYCNKPGGRAGWGNKGSVYDYFYTQSNGRLRYSNNVTYYVRVPNPYSYYNDTSTAQNSGTNGRKLLTDAVNILIAQGYDFSGLSVNASNGRVIATNLLWAGNSSGVWASGLWPHRSSVGPLNIGGGKYIYDYQCTNIGSSGFPTIGTFCHEDGHLIGKYPDYYDYDGVGEGVGNHCLMGAGNHATQTNPTNISSYLKYHSGWMDAIELNNTAMNALKPIRFAVQVDNSNVFKYTNPDATWPNEYFLIENRSKIGGWEATSGLPDSGLMISHIHHTGNQSRNERTETQHYEHSVEQAEGNFELEGAVAANRGDTSDYFHSGGTGPSTAFGDATLPNSKWWKGADGTAASGTSSGLEIHSVSDAAAVMTFVYGTGTPSGAATTQLTKSILENAIDYGNNAASQSFHVYNSGGGTLSYTVSDNAAWLSCSVASGTATTEADAVTLSYTTSALAAGTHTATITVDGAAGGIKTITVTLTVNNQPFLTRSPTSISVNGIAGLSGPTSTFDLRNTGGGTAAYTITKTQSWLTVTPASGTIGLERDTINLAFNATALAAGTYTDTITITATSASNSPLTIPVTFTVDPSDMILTTPNGGENWLLSSTQNITWASSLGGNVKIELFKAGVLNTAIAANTPNDGSYSWTIPGALTPAADYKIRITSIESPTKSDESFNNFTISQDMLALALDTQGLFWTTTSTRPWFHQTTTTKDTVDAAQCANITHSEASTMETTITGPGTMTFWWQVSSESGFDFLRFYLNGVEQTGSLAKISGNVAWVQKTVTIPAGNNVVKWTYDKDGSVDGGTLAGVAADTAWVDQVVFTPDAQAEIAVEYPTNTGLTDGGSTVDFGSVNTGNNTSLTFTIKNVGTSDLTGIAATISGANSADYSITTSPAPTVIPGSSTTCIVRFAPGASGSRTALLQIASNDSNENPFDINLTGVGLGPGSLSVAGAGGLTSSGSIGGPFSPSSIIYILSNPGSTPINWNATETAAWINLSASGATAITNGFSGTLAAGASTNVTVSINTNADSLAANTYNDAVTFTNTTNGVGNTTRAVALTVNTPPAVNAGSDQTIILTGSSWSPTEVSLGLWLDASDDATVTLNGSNVSQWSDKSGLGRHATATGTAQPAATPAGLNGKRVLTFNGSTHVLNANLDFLAGINHSAFIVTKPTIYSNIYGAANGSAGANSLHVGFSSATNYRMNFWANDYGPALTANFVPGSSNIMNYVWTAGTGKQILANGISEGTNTNAGVIGTMSGGGRIGRTTGHAFFGGDIAEFIAVTGSVSTTDREKMEGYLAHKWGLAGNLSLTHPYKAASPNSAEAVANLDGTTSDADGNSLTRTWSLVSGPAAVTLGNASVDDTTATFITTGVYTLRLTVSDGFTQVIDDVVITVNPSPTGFTVKYNGNGNTGGSVPTDAANYASAATVTVLGNTGSLTRTGYTFAGWNTAANGTGTTYQPGATFSISANVNLYAMWTGLPYTVTFNKQLGTGGANSVSATMGSAMPTATAPTRTGYTFAGYFTLSGGAGIQYYTETMQSARNWDIAAATTLHAHWTANTYTVTFDANGGGTPSPTTQTVSYNSAYGTLATVARTGYTFNGWFTASSGGSLVDASTTVTALADHTLYAQWSATTYTVSYHVNNATSGSAPADQIKSYGVNLTLATNSGGLSRIGYALTGWNTAANGSGTSYAVGATYSVNASVTLYAQWTANTYTVSFDANGGSAPAPSSKSVTYDAAYGALPTTTRSSYIFNGWFTAPSDGQQVAADTLVTANANHTLYAQWTLVFAEMEVTRDGNPVSVGDYDAVTGTNASVETKVNYAIANAGNINLTISGVTITGQQNCAASVDTQPSATVATFGNTGMILSVIPAASGAWSFTVSIANNDTDENPYAWTVHGVALSSGTLVLTSVADTYINSASAGSSYGTTPNTTMSLYYRASGPNVDERRSLLRFDLSTVPANATIVSASLKLVQSNNISGLVSLFNVTGAWDESATTTWTNSSNLVGNIAYGSESAPGTTNTALPNIILNDAGLNMVRSWASTPATNFGIGVKTANSANNKTIDLHTREATNAAYRPTLTITYTSNPQVAEIHTTRNGTVVADGGTDSVSGTYSGLGTQLTYAIANLGNSSLTLTTPVSVSGASNCSVSVTSQPSAAVAASTETLLVLTVTPGAGGAWSATISIANNDPDENPYNWTISGNAATGYAAWVGSTFANGILGNQSMAVDFDNDGLSTGVEWVVGGDPTLASDANSKKPVFDNTSDSQYFIYSYRRSDLANADPKTSIAVEYGSNLTGWTSAVDPTVNVNNNANIEIIETNDGHGVGVDKVDVKIKRTLAPSGALFSRLKVVVSP